MLKNVAKLAINKRHCQSQNMAIACLSRSYSSSCCDNLLLKMWRESRRL